MCKSVYYVCIYVYVYTCVCVRICAHASTWSFLSRLSLGFSEQFFLDHLAVLHAHWATTLSASVCPQPFSSTVPALTFNAKQSKSPVPG